MKAKYIFSLIVLLILGGSTIAGAQTYSYYGPDCSMMNCDSYYYQQQPAYYYPSTGVVALSQSNITIGVGQVATVYVYGGSARTTTSSNWGVVQHALFNNIITIQGLAQGSTVISVCSDGYGYYQNNCARLNVTVRGNGYNYNYPYNYPYNYQDNNYPYYYQNDLLDQTSIRINKGDREELDITTRGSNRDVYVDDNSDDRIASARISGDQLVIKGLKRGSTDIRICDDYTCSTIEVTVRD